MCCLGQPIRQFTLSSAQNILLSVMYVCNGIVIVVSTDLVILLEIFELFSQLTLCMPEKSVDNVSYVTVAVCLLLWGKVRWYTPCAISNWQDADCRLIYKNTHGNL